MNINILIVTIIDIIGLLAAIIIGLDIVWRTEGKLDIFAKFLTAGLFARAIDQIIIFLQFQNQTPQKYSWTGLIVDAFLLLSTIELFRLIRELDGEKK